MSLDKGVYYPVIIPFDRDYQVDHETLRELVNFGVEKGLHGIFALGSVGQGPVMSIKQRKDAIETIVKTNDGRVPVVAHIGTPDTQSSIQLARHAEKTGVDMIGVLPPYYYTSGSSTSMAHDFYEIQAHFRQIADATDSDMLVYNNEKFTGVDLSPDDIGGLAHEIPAIKALKSGSTSRSIERYVEKTPNGFQVFTNIRYLLPSFYNGIQGSINPPTSVFPEVCVKYWDAIQEEHLTRANEHRQTLQDIQKIVGEFGEKFRRGIYMGLFELRGITIEKYPKWETRPIAEGDLMNLRDEFERIGLGEYLEN